MGLTPAKQFASPAVNVIENEKEYTLELAAPGMTKNDFNVRLENDNELVISLQKTDEKKEEKKNYLRREFSYASYQQTFVVPDEIQSTDYSLTIPPEKSTVSGRECGLHLIW